MFNKNFIIIYNNGYIYQTDEERLAQAKVDCDKGIIGAYYKEEGGYKNVYNNN